MNSKCDKIVFPTELLLKRKKSDLISKCDEILFPDEVLFVRENRGVPAECGKVWYQRASLDERQMSPPGRAH